MNTTKEFKRDAQRILGGIITILLVIAVGLWGYWGMSQTLFAEKLVSAGRFTVLLTGIDPDVAVTQGDAAMIGLTGGSGQGRGSGQGTGRGRVSSQESEVSTESGLSRHSAAADWATRLLAYAGVFFGIALIVYLVFMVLPKWLHRLPRRSSEPPLS